MVVEYRERGKAKSSRGRGAMFCFGPLLLFCGEFKTTIREKREEIKHKSTDLYLIKSKKVIWEGK